MSCSHLFASKHLPLPIYPSALHYTLYSSEQIYPAHQDLARRVIGLALSLT
ncbi:MAG TPA: hypothetical protein VKV19_08490 [Ktedonobacteraceae bacterium]|nr:hypothetical protein [Ktedonobacteraceae bacterium]